MALQGTLETFTVPDVLRLLSTTKKSGLFTLEGDRGTGRVWLNEGRLAAAASDRENGSDADSVLFDLLRFTTASFRFDPEVDPPAGDADSEHDIEQVLERAEQLLEEWREIESVIPSLDAWVRLVPELNHDAVTITADLWPALAVLGGGSTGRRIGTDLDLGELDACRRLRDLVDLGVAEVDHDFVSAGERMGLAMPTPVADATPPPPPPPPPPPVDEPALVEEPDLVDESVASDPIDHVDAEPAPEPMPEPVPEPAAVYDDEPVLVDHGLSQDEVASLGANLAGFVAQPSEPEPFVVDDVQAEADHEDTTFSMETVDEAHAAEVAEVDPALAVAAEWDATVTPDEVAPAEGDDDADEFLSQLANLSPKAARAIEAIDGGEAAGAHGEVPSQTADAVTVGDADGDVGDEELNKNLLLKFLSSAKN